MSRENTSVPPARNPMWLSLLAISMSTSGANRRRICSSALGGTISSADVPPCAGTSIFARRCPLVATIRMRSGRSSHNTPFRIGRLSSVDAANATWPTSLCTTPAAAFQAPSNFTAGNDGNSSRGRPSSLNLERPHSIPTRDSPAAVKRTGPDGRDRRADRDVEIGARQPQALLGGLDEGVSQHRQRRFGRDGRCHGAQTFLKLLPCDRELHPPFSPRWSGVKNLLLYQDRTTSSNSRRRGNVGDSAQPVKSTQR